MMKVLFYVVFMMGFFCQSFACEKMKARYVFNKKKIETTELFCIEGSKANSLNCQQLLFKKCPFSKIEKNLSFQDFIGPIGSPGFGLCHHLEGSPQLYEIEVTQNTWKSFSRCISKDKKEFVDIEDLVHHYP